MGISREEARQLFNHFSNNGSVDDSMKESIIDAFFDIYNSGVTINNSLIDKLESCDGKFLWKAFELLNANKDMKIEDAVQQAKQIIETGDDILIADHGITLVDFKA